MNFLLVLFHLKCFFKKVFLKMLYMKKITFGKNLQFRKNFSVMISKNGMIKIGENCFFNNDCSISSFVGIEIGDNCLFGENVKVYDNNHKFSLSFNINSQGYKLGNIKIGNNVWVGSSVIILKGVTIGDNCVIGAGSVIDRNIPNNSLVVANRDVKIIRIEK